MIYRRIRYGAVVVGIVAAFVMPLPSPTAAVAQDAGSKVDSWETMATDSSPPDYVYDQVLDSERVFEVPEATRSEAIRLLEAIPIISLTNEQVKRLLGRSINPDAALAQIVKRVEADAQTQEQRATDPLYAASADALRRAVVWQREHAAFLRGLVGRLKPYLVRAVSKNELAEFSVTLSGDELWVQHGSLGHSVPPSRRRPLIVFLERNPKHVHVRWLMAN